MVVANSWYATSLLYVYILALIYTRAILHNEKSYPDPLTFNPERFLKNGQIDPDVQDPAVACFGFGRRICPGRWMAYESAWIAIASTLATLTIAKAKQPDGTPITPKGAYLLAFLWCVTFHLHAGNDTNYNGVAIRSRLSATFIHDLRNIGFLSKGPLRVWHYEYRQPVRHAQFTCLRSCFHDL